MTDAAARSSLASQAQRLGLRALTKAGGMPVMARPQIRGRVEKVLYASSRRGFQLAEAASKRAFPPASGGGEPVRARPTRPGDLFDLTPTEDQQMLREAAGALADDLIRPAGAVADRERAVPEPVRAAAQEMGIALIGVPTDLGGIAEERSAVTTALVLEELARGDLGIAAALMAPAAVATALSAYGSAAQQATYLPAFTGEEPVASAALALLEPQPLFDATRPRTAGVTRGGDIVVSGTKALVPGAASSELFIVSARIDGVARLVIIEPDAKGLAVIDDPAMGVRAARTGRLTLDNVVIPRSNILGTPQDHLDAVRRARLAWSAAACGTAQAVLDQVSAYVKERKAFGEPIGHRQAVAFMVADIGIELAALRLVVWKAAARLDAGGDASALVAQARALTARHGAAIGSHGVQLLGGHGFVKEFDNERWYRDLRGAGILEGGLLV